MLVTTVQRAQERAKRATQLAKHSIATQQAKKFIINLNQKFTALCWLTHQNESSVIDGWTRQLQDLGTISHESINEEILQCKLKEIHSKEQAYQYSNGYAPLSDRMRISVDAETNTLTYITWTRPPYINTLPIHPTLLPNRLTAIRVLAEYINIQNKINHPGQGWARLFPRSSINVENNERALNIMIRIAQNSFQRNPPIQLLPRGHLREHIKGLLSDRSTQQIFPRRGMILDHI